ncbi:GntR family transcriptional regulator [Streptomyces phytohabitans]|uniref:GntR family transcriptional regulator n=1 Tax=Streptomyces phytohabitans TaxID=1150371 RepID=UPI00345BEB5E
MSLSTNDPRPPYQQVADLIRGEITSGKIKSGEQLPSHRELQERFDIASMTARSALRVLRDEGLIYTVQGRGSYVRDAIPSDDARGQSASEIAVPQNELLALRDQLRRLNAELQALKHEVAEMKTERQREQE